MKLKTQFVINIVAFSIILIIIGASVGLTQQQITDFNNQESISHDIQIGASDLNYISSNYFLYQSNSSVGLWQAKVSTLSNELSTVNSTNPSQQELVGTVSNDLENLNIVFAGVTSFLSNAPRNASVRVLPSFQTQWNRMAVQIQALAFDSQQLSQSMQDKTNQAILLNTVLTVVLLAVFGAFFVISYYLNYRKTLKSISKLKKRIGIIGSGNLDYAIEGDDKDEISDISKSVDQMASNLKTVTASKEILETEIAERKKVQEALQQAQSKLQEYANNLEKLVEERTKQLNGAERLAAIGATAGMVGHDIRNPLQAITSDVYLIKTELASTPESEEKSNSIESLTEIEKNIDYINKIVADLQDYARPLNPTAKGTDLENLCRDILLKSNLPNSIEATFKVEKEAKQVMADPDLLKRIISNLILNSVQAMPNGGKLFIHAYRKEGGLVIEVQDTGEGIPDEVKTKLFTPMFTTKSKGQGFGLAVVKRVTEAMNGTVSFESESGKGTTFIVRLPPPRS